MPTLPDSMKFLDVSNNRLRALPASLPSNLEVFDASNNGMVGTIPPIGPAMVRIALDNNKLTGQLPSFTEQATTSFGRRRLSTRRQMQEVRLVGTLDPKPHWIVQTHYALSECLLTRPALYATSPYAPRARANWRCGLHPLPTTG
jgi:hypothetical protein